MHSAELPLPLELARHVKKASVAPHVRSAFGSLPQPVRLDATIASDTVALPLSARQLLKLGAHGERVRLCDVTLAEPGAALSFSLSVGERRLVLGREDLEHELRAVLTRILGALFDASDVTHILSSLAFQSSSLTTLRTITSRMLASTDVDEALYLMLAGITSGYGLGFNRAALFLHDPARGAFVGKKGIGPFDAAEAHRIWEEIELEDLTIEHIIDDYAAGRFDTRFQQRIQATVLTAGEAAGDELADALSGTGDLLFEGTEPTNPDLRALGARGEFVLAALRPHGSLLGLVFADNCYSGTPVSREALAHLALYIDQTALVWENLSLLSRVAEMARTDGLTGVLNRREFDTRFELEKSRCERSGASLSVLLVDVDDFKRTNDAKGHEAGDAVLRTLGALLRRALRTHDTVARYGGDEFVALLPDVTREQLRSAARRIGSLARAAGISVSIGGASWPGDAGALSSLFAKADEQLYLAKNAGRGCAFVAGARRDFAAESVPP